MSIIAVLLIVFATGVQEDGGWLGWLFQSKGEAYRTEKAELRQSNIDCLYKNHTDIFEKLIPDDIKENNEATLKEAFDDIYQAYGDSSKDSLDDYIYLSKDDPSKNNQARAPWQLIKDINQNVQNVRVLDIVDPNTKTEDSNWDVLKDIDPVVFHKAIGALVVLNDKKDIFSGNKILDGLDAVDSRKLPEKEKIDSIIKLGPKFYINTPEYSDYQLAHELEKFYRNALCNNFTDEDIEDFNLSKLLTLAKDPINKYHLEKDLPKDIEEAINTLFPTQTDAANKPGEGKEW